jgi:cyclic-di-GMP-binding protein
VGAARGEPLMPSFDVVSELNQHEVMNAVDQANRELTQRFDFKDTGARFELQDFVVTLHAQVDFQLKQMLEILKLRLGKRGIDLACMEVKDPQTNLAAARQEVILRHGIDQEAGKKILRLVKDSKLKTQASLQGDKVRVTGKKKDDLQDAIKLLREAKLDVPLQFNNFRD